MRIRILLVIAALTAASCSGGADPTTTPPPSTLPPSTAPPTSSSTTAAPTSTLTTTGPPTTTTAAPDVIDVELLVAGPDAVSLVGRDLEVTPLVDSPAAFAVDDLAGGVIFQVERWSSLRQSVVYRVAADRREAVATLIPTMEQGLVLNGVARDGDDTFIYYTRREGTTPDDLADTFRRYNLTTGEVSELLVIGGWEWGAFPVSISDSLVLFNWGAESLHGMNFADLEGNAAAVAADPDPADGYFDSCHQECPSVGEISQDGDRLVYVEEVDGVAVAVIRHVASGAEIRRVELGARDGWWVGSFDLGPDYLAVNRDSPDGMLPAWLFDLRRVTPEAIELPVPGEAYLPRSQVALGGVAPAP